MPLTNYAFVLMFIHVARINKAMKYNGSPDNISFFLISSDFHVCTEPRLQLCQNKFIFIVCNKTFELLQHISFYVYDIFLQLIMLQTFWCN